MWRDRQPVTLEEPAATCMELEREIFRAKRAIDLAKSPQEANQYTQRLHELEAELKAIEKKLEEANGNTQA
jgi:predicted metallo-beta-lactamase superfamily hydrolase